MVAVATRAPDAAASKPNAPSHLAAWADRIFRRVRRADMGKIGIYCFLDGRRFGNPLRENAKLPAGCAEHYII